MPAAAQVSGVSIHKDPQKTPDLSTNLDFPLTLPSYLPMKKPTTQHRPPVPPEYTGGNNYQHHFEVYVKYLVL